MALAKILWTTKKEKKKKKKKKKKQKTRKKRLVSAHTLGISSRTMEIEVHLHRAIHG